MYISMCDGYMMTEQEYQALPPREKDGLIAKHIFGWVHCNEVLGWRPSKNSVTHSLLEPKHYTSSIEASWEVVEKMHGQGFACSILAGIATKCCVFLHWDKRSFCVDGVPNVPEAICLAALKAVGFLK